jgi:hypothetical protein
MKIRTDYKNTPEHLRLDPEKAKCPCGAATTAFWIESTNGRHLGFECENKHLFDLCINAESKMVTTKIIENEAAA